MKGKFIALGAIVALALTFAFVKSSSNCCDLPSDCCKSVTEASATAPVQTAAASVSTPETAPVNTPAGTEVKDADCCKANAEEKTGTCCGLPCPFSWCKK